MHPATYIFRLERQAQVVGNRPIPRKIITCRLESGDPTDLAQSFTDFMLSCGYEVNTVVEAMTDAADGLKITG